MTAVATITRRVTRSWPERWLSEALLVTALFAAILCFVYPQVVFTDDTFAPGTPAGQSGRRGAEYPYGDARKGPLLDAGSYSWIFEPMGRVVHEAYADGAAPLWNPYSALGVPLLGDLQSAPLGPFYAPVFVKPTQNAWDLVILLRYLVGGVGCFMLLRALGASPAAAFAPAVGYLLSAAYALHGLSLSLSVEALAPWLLLAILVLVRRPGWLPFTAVALLVAAATLGGQPEVLVVLAWVAIAWALYWWFREGRPRRALLELAGAGVAGGLLTAPQVLLGAQYVGLSNDLHLGRLGDVRMSFDTLKVVLLGDYDLARVESLARMESLGIVMVALAVAGIAGRRVAGVSQGFMLAATGVWAVRALDLPGAEIVGLLPGVDDVNVSRYGMFVYLLAGAISASAGVQAIMRGSRRALVAGGAAGLLLPLVLWVTGGRAEGIVLPALAFAAAVALVALAVYRWPRLAPALAVVFALNLLVLIPQRFARVHNPYRPKPFTAFVQEALRPGERIAAVESVMHPQVSAGFELPDPRIGLALNTKRFDSYLYDLIRTQQTNFNGFLRPDDADSPFLAALGVRYVLAPRRVQLDDSLRRVFPAQGAPRDVTVWEIPEPYGRAWIPAGIQPTSGMESDRDLLRAGDGDLRTVSVVEDPTPEMLAARGKGEVTVERIGWNDAVFHVRADAPAVVVVADQFYPGWKATVDERETQIRPANLAMRAIAVPEGEHEVVFSYEPQGWRYGLVLAGVGLLILVGRAVAPPVVSRLRR